MNDTAEVYLWGTRIGVIHQDITKTYASFEYDKNFLNSEIGMADFLEAGKKMEIKERRCKDIINEISASVARFSTFAEQAGIKEKTCNYIESIITRNRQSPL